MWLIVTMVADTCWVSQKTIKTFREREMILLPEDEKLLPCLFLKHLESERHEEAQALAQEFLSDSCWSVGEPMKIKQIHSQSNPVQSQKFVFRLVPGPLETDYLVDPRESDKRLALALYREAMNAENSAHKFLNFFRIINIRNRSGAKQQEWINLAVTKLTDFKGLARIKEIQDQGIKDIGAYLYKEKRCAIAHATTVAEALNPDDPTALVELYFDIPLVRCLAEFRIEEEYGLRSRPAALQAFPFALEDPNNVWLCERFVEWSKPHPDMSA